MALALSLSAAVFFAVLLLGMLVRSRPQPRTFSRPAAHVRPDRHGHAVRARRRSTRQRTPRQRGPFAPRFGRRAS
jgi:hypothetical protein